LVTVTSHFTENLLQGLAVLLAFSVAACSSKSNENGTPPPTIEGWDWNGVIGTGQSLSVGAQPNLSTTQPYSNLKLSLGSSGNAAVPPWDPTLAELSMVPLVEPIRALATGYPGPYPGNIYGETPHSAMANQITALVKAADAKQDYVTVHSVVGESGQGIVQLKKPADLNAATAIMGRAYAATIFEVNAITRLAQEAGKSYGVSVVTMTHGESDVGNPAYEAEVVQLLADYNADIAAITGQTRKIPMYLSQQHGVPNGTAIGQRPLVNLTQWRLGVDRKGEFVCTGPQYQYPGNSDGVHLTALGYQLLGEKYGQVYHEREVLGHDWQPLAPTGVERDGRVVTVHFHVPVPPLNWDDGLDAPLITEWVNGHGFELRGPSGSIVIASVEIVDDSVKITADSDLPASGLIVGYALAGQGVQMKSGSLGVRWGQLRDSDPFQGKTTELPNPNYGVSFEMLVP
jgi:hypothetical protein